MQEYFLDNVPIFLSAVIFGFFYDYFLELKDTLAGN
jgi:hypothetical protein